jgi:hypothetical protein
MATVGETSRPGYVYDSATDVWIPVGIGPHSHTPAAIGAVSSSVVTAKGDLIVATSSGVVTNKSVGTDGTYLVADSTQTTGVNWAGPSTMAGRNAVLNSNMSVWQRGTTFTGNGSANTYAGDRWHWYNNGTSMTISRQVTGDTTNLPFIQYCTRVQRAAASTNTNTNWLTMNFETINSIPFAGKTATLSFYARAGANFSGAFYAQVATGTGTDQNYLNSGYTGAATPISTAVTLTTTWQRFSYSGTIASTATEIGLQFTQAPTGTAGTNDYFEITGVQLEVGSVATPYAPNGATQQAELAACQRYYWRTSASAGSQTATGIMGITNSTTNLVGVVRPPVTMRIIPSSVDFSAVGVQSTGSALTAISAVTISSDATNDTAQLNFTSSGFTANLYGLVRGTTGAGYVGLSAEL